MIYRTRAPQPVLTPFIELLWFYEDLDVDHSKEKLLPDASMELIIDLSEGPKRLYDSRDLDRFTTQPLLDQRAATAVYRARSRAGGLNGGGALSHRRCGAVLRVSAF